LRLCGEISINMQKKSPLLVTDSMALLNTIKQKIGISPQPMGSDSAAILSAIQKIMENRKKIFRKQILVPGEYQVELATDEYLQLEPVRVPFCKELEEAVWQLVKKQNYSLEQKDIRVHLISGTTAVSGEPVVTALFTESENEEPSSSFSLLISPETDLEEHYPLEPGEYLIGRGRNADIFPQVEDELMSRSHCLLVVEKEVLFLEDLESRNGVIMNEKLCSKRIQLFAGDRFLLGNTEFEVRQ